MSTADTVSTTPSPSTGTTSTTKTPWRRRWTATWIATLLLALVIGAAFVWAVGATDGLGGTKDTPVLTEQEVALPGYIAQAVNDPDFDLRFADELVEGNGAVVGINCPAVAAVQSVGVLPSVVTGIGPGMEDAPGTIVCTLYVDANHDWVEDELAPFAYSFGLGALLTGFVAIFVSSVTLRRFGWLDEDAIESDDEDEDGSVSAAAQR